MNVFNILRRFASQLNMDCFAMFLIRFSRESLANIYDLFKNRNTIND